MASLACRRLHEFPSAPRVAANSVPTTCHDHGNMQLKQSCSPNSNIIMNERCSHDHLCPHSPRVRSLVVTALHDMDVSLPCIFPVPHQRALMNIDHSPSSAPRQEFRSRELHQSMPAAAVILSINHDKMDGRASTTCVSSNSNEDDVSRCSSSETLTNATDSTHQGPLHNLISLREALPAKRGLSRYFAGKSQSFASLADVYSVVDLAKPENPFVKRRKTGACNRQRTYVAPTSLHHMGDHPDRPTSIPLKSFSSLELQKASL